MDNKMNNNTAMNGNTQGQWVPVDPATLGFQINGAPNQVVTGPDGHTYRIGGDPQYGGVPSNAQNAIPTPSSIVQMPPIVQPIALVPYTSQNQPLLQYDPYSRPVDPQVTPPRPNYVKKPYRGLSITALLLAIAGLVIGLLLAQASYKGAAGGSAFLLTGIGAVKALLAAFGVEMDSDYYQYRLANVGGDDLLGTIVAYAVPALVIIICVFFLLLVIKYLVKFAKKKTPRGFSVLAFVNFLLCIALAGILLGLTRAEAKEETIGSFFMLESAIHMGMGLIISLVLSLVLFILPFFARKNAYMLEQADDAKKTFVID